MKRGIPGFSHVLGGFITIAVTGVAIALAALFSEGKALDRESKAFVDASVPAIAAKWSQEELLKRASPELRASVNAAQLNTAFGSLSQLGGMIGYEGARGEANISYFLGGGAAVSALYIAKATFRNGSAIFRIVLIKRGGQWMIQNFHVDPEPRARADESDLI